jgi:exosortase B
MVASKLGPVIGSKPITPLLILLVGFFALYIPVYYELSTTRWTESDEMHGPIVITVAAWALWTSKDVIRTSITDQNHPIGWVVLALGLLLFFIGRLLEIQVLAVGSQVFTLAGGLWILGGISTLKIGLFPLIFLFFAIPLPGNFIDALTGELKQVVSVIAEWILYESGYPIARSGVMLNIGQYQLLVADACSGLKSMFSLSAIGFLYIYLVKHESLSRNILLALSLIPIAFVANILRVLTLILVTYHFGDAAGQGFVHDFAGLVLFVIAIIGLSAFDALLGLWFLRNK